MTLIDEYVDKLVNDHWAYVEALLKAHAVEDTTAYEFHYKSAFKHGWKHSEEYYREVRQ